MAIKPLSILIERMVPRFVFHEYPMFITFLEKVFGYMEQEVGQYDIVANLLNYRDVDSTLDIFEDAFKAQYAVDFPLVLATDIDLLVKNIRDFYLSKGTEASFQFLFQTLFGSDATIWYPKFNILKCSDGNWYTPEYIILEDGNNNIPPEANGIPYNINAMVGQFIHGASSGAIAFVEGTYLIPLTDPDYPQEGSIQITDRVGTFIEGEQILIGINLVSNGDFSSGTVDWDLSLAGDQFTRVVNNQLVIEQNPNNIVNKYVSQNVAVNGATQYWLTVRIVDMDAAGVRITAGYEKGESFLWDSGDLYRENTFDITDISYIAPPPFDTPINIPNHGFKTEDAVLYTSSVTPPEPLVSGTIYYVIKGSGNNTIRLAETKEDAAQGNAISFVLGTGDSGSHNLALKETFVTKLLDATPASKNEIWVNLHNEMSGGNEAVTFDGLAMVENLSSTPLLYIANSNGSGLRTGTSTFKGTSGFLSDSTMVLQDNFFYQEYSYVVQSGVDINSFEKIVRDLVHPAGMIMFAEVYDLSASNAVQGKISVDNLMEFTDTDVSIGLNAITIPSHGLSTGRLVTYTAGATPVAGLSDGGEYFVRVDDVDTFRLFDTQLDALEDNNEVDITSTGSADTHRFDRSAHYNNNLLTKFIIIDFDMQMSSPLEMTIEPTINLELDFHINITGGGLTYSDIEENREDPNYQLLYTRQVSDFDGITINDFISKANEKWPYISSPPIVDHEDNPL